MSTNYSAPEPFGKYLKARLEKRGAGPRPFESVIISSPLQADVEDDGDYLAPDDVIYHTGNFYALGEYIFVHEDEVIATC